MSTNALKVHMLILMHNDVNKAVEFYKSLGMQLKFHVINKWAEFDIHGVRLGLAQTEHELPERRTGIVLEVPDVKAYYEQAKQAGISFLTEPAEAVHGIVLSFKDPGNNVLDLYQPTPEKVREAVRKAHHDDCCSGKSEECSKKQDNSQACCGKC